MVTNRAGLTVLRSLVASILLFKCFIQLARCFGLIKAEYWELASPRTVGAAGFLLAGSPGGAKAEGVLLNHPDFTKRRSPRSAARVLPGGHFFRCDRWLPTLVGNRSLLPANRLAMQRLYWILLVDQPQGRGGAGGWARDRWLVPLFRSLLLPFRAILRKLNKIKTRNHV